MQCWAALETAATDGRHAWHTPALANVTDEGPAARTVVLRAASGDARTLTCHTDTRSPKALALARDARVSWLFYDPIERVQLRAEGTARLETAGEAVERHWGTLRDSSQALYGQSGTPGAPLEPGENAAASRVHFLLLECTITRLDWLQLRGTTHWRAHMSWNGTHWDAAWVNP